MGTIRRFDVLDIRTTYDINTFVETGTLHGDGVDFAVSSGFENIISIEIDHELSDLAKKKYVNHPNVNIVEGNSFEILLNLIPTLKNNCLFWLDAHFPGADVYKRAYDSEPNMDIRLPLEKELDIILEHRQNFTDVIIADDLWLYEDEDKCEIGKFDIHMEKCGHDITRERAVSGKNCGS